MKRVFSALGRCLILCGLLLALSANALAGGFALYEYSNRSVAMGTTGIAQAGDASVVATNPALMTRLEDNQTLVGMVAIQPAGEVVIGGNSTKTKDQTFLVPHAYYVHKYNDNVWLGVGEFTRFGLGMEYPDNWIGKDELTNILLETFSLNPSIAFKFNEHFSAAVGIELMKGNVLIEKTPTIATLPTKVKIEGETVTATGNLGLHYQFNDQWGVGFTYRAPAKVCTDGKIKFSGGAPLADAKAYVATTLPSSYSLGVAYQPTDDWNIEFDVVHTRWEHTKNLKIDTDSAVGDSVVDMYYKNTWRLQLGTEYWVKDWAAVRLGYIWDQSPIRHGSASFMLPSNDRHLFSGGLGFKGENWTCDLAYSYIVSKDRHGMKIGTHDNVDFKDGDTHIAGLSVGYVF